MKTLRAVWKDRDLRKKCLIVLGLLVFVRILAEIPAPGVNSDYFEAVIESNAALGILNVMTGGGLSSLSIVTLSVTPYITSSIIMQLLAVVIPSLGEMQKAQDKKTQRRYKWIIFGVGAALALVESLSMAIGFGRQGMLISYTAWNVILVTAIWTIGAVFLAGLGEFISEKLIGNGISLILTINILASFPSDLYSVWEAINAGSVIGVKIAEIAGVIVFFVLLLAFIVWLNSTCREVSVVHAGKLAGSSTYAQRHEDVIPLKICQGSVIPVIFASSLLSLPTLITTMIGHGEDSFIVNLLNSSNWFVMTRPVYTLGVLVYIGLIFGFTYFYIDISINPIEMADNLKKTGATIPGIRPGRPTSDYLRHQLNLTAFIGATALSIIAVIPYIVGGLTGLSNLSLLGTSLIIVVGVIIETKELLESKVKGSLYMEKVYKGGIFHHG